MKTNLCELNESADFLGRDFEPDGFRFFPELLRDPGGELGLTGADGSEMKSQ